MDEDISNRSEAEWRAFRGWVERLSADPAGSGAPIPFVDRLKPDDLQRFRADMLTVLMESDHSGDAIDAREVADVLREFAELVHWDGPLWVSEVETAAAYRLEVPARDLKALRTASQAVQRVVEELFSGPLIENPFGVGREVSQRVKKMPDRDLWQVYLPD